MLLQLNQVPLCHLSTAVPRVLISLSPSTRVGHQENKARPGKPRSPSWAPTLPWWTWILWCLNHHNLLLLWTHSWHQVGFCTVLHVSVGAFPSCRKNSAQLGAGGVKDGWFGLGFHGYFSQRIMIKSRRVSERHSGLAQHRDKSLKTPSLCSWAAAELYSSSSPHSELSVLGWRLLKMGEFQLDFVKAGEITLGR